MIYEGAGKSSPHLSAARFDIYIYIYIFTGISSGDEITPAGHATAVILGNVESGSRRCAICVRTDSLFAAFMQMRMFPFSVLRAPGSGGFEQKERKRGRRKMEERKKRERKREKERNGKRGKNCRSYEMTRIRKRLLRLNPLTRRRTLELF